MSADWLLDGVTVCADGDEERKLLNDVRARFQAGKITLLIGKNGAGKSTLLETMAGIRTVRDGSIRLGDASLWLPHGRRRRKPNRDVLLKLGISMQHSESQWFASTVKEELLYSLKPYGLEEATAAKRINRALADVGLEEAVLERDPWTLSGGQQRRLSLACLLACEPDWLLLDEPTAGLDAAGISRLCAVLQAHRAAGRGAVVATHDLDALLPLADALAVVTGGAVREAAPAAALTHAAAAPQAQRALAELRAAGAALPPETALREGAPWPAPRAVAAALAAGLAKPARDLAAVSAAAPEEPLAAGDSALIPAHSGRLGSHPFDPRALIAVYLLLASGILAQQTLLETALAAVLICSLLLPFRSLLKPWMRLIRAYAVLIVIFCIIGGISFEPLAFDGNNSLPVLNRFGKLLLIMLLGLPMLKLMPPMRLQRAIEQTFGWLGRLHVPIHSFALLVTLIFRFIPLLIGEWERFAKLAHARGKAVTPINRVPVRMLHAILIPYVRSMVRLAEQMADALEARGFGYAKRKPVYGFRLRIGSSDVYVLVIAGIASLFLYLLSFFL